jgi:hypothetical protein
MPDVTAELGNKKKAAPEGAAFFIPSAVSLQLRRSCVSATSRRASVLPERRRRLSSKTRPGLPAWGRERVLPPRLPARARRQPPPEPSRNPFWHASQPLLRLPARRLPARRRLPRQALPQRRSSSCAERGAFSALPRASARDRQQLRQSRPQPRRRLRPARKRPAWLQRFPLRQTRPLSSRPDLRLRRPCDCACRHACRAGASSRLRSLRPRPRSRRRRQPRRRLLPPRLPHHRTRSRPCLLPPQRPPASRRAPGGRGRVRHGGGGGGACGCPRHSRRCAAAAGSAAASARPRSPRRRSLPR